MSQQFDDVIADMKGYIERDVAAGFADAEEIVETAVDVFSDEADPNLLRAAAEQFTREALALHLEAQADWPPVTDCDRLDGAFSELERRGVISRQNFSCCGSCGAGEIWEEIEETREAGRRVRGYTFYHAQDTESAADGYGLCLNYGAVEESEEAALRVAHEVADVIRSHGLKVTWDGSWSRRIEVELDWKRRRSPEATA